MLGYYSEMILLKEVTNSNVIPPPGPGGDVSYDVFGGTESFGEGQPSVFSKRRFYGYLKFLPLKVKDEYKSSGYEEVEAAITYRTAEMDIDTHDRIEVEDRLFEVVGYEWFGNIRHKSHRVLLKEITNG